jgi:hypothetical protein
MSGFFGTRLNQSLSGTDWQQRCFALVNGKKTSNAHINQRVNICKSAFSERMMSTRNIWPNRSLKAGYARLSDRSRREYKAGAYPYCASRRSRNPHSQACERLRSFRRRSQGEAAVLESPRWQNGQQPMTMRARSSSCSWQRTALRKRVAADIALEQGLFSRRLGFRI